MPKYKYEIGDVVLITWRDSTQQEGWAQATDIDDEPALITSVGIVYKKGRKHIAIAGEWSPDKEEEDDFNRPFSIPLGCIESLEVLRTLERE